MGLSDHQIGVLANYNAERARGLVHTAEWMEKMAALQKLYNEWLASLDGIHVRTGEE